MANINSVNKVGSRIKFLRKRKGWPQSEIAKKLSISSAAYSKIELGFTGSNISRLQQIAQLLEVHVLDLLNDSDVHILYQVAATVNDLKEKITLCETKIGELQTKTINLYEELHRSGK